MVTGLDELDFRNPGLTTEQRFRRLMETAGLSTLVVAMTNIVAFGLGAISDIPAIHWCDAVRCRHPRPNASVS